ncbi:MAG: hypothetical protein ACTHW1_10575 [Ancrocorticia sp.]|uniref:hypothetical protein n=1 Tax=Ancrocorticia sp. TaxID=2593684 RepID=UPI003F8E052C
MSTQEAGRLAGMEAEASKKRESAHSELAGLQAHLAAGESSRGELRPEAGAEGLFNGGIGGE